MFMHGGWLHLLGNMLFLWIFGDNVEDRLGHAKFLVFYLLAGIAATLAQFALAPHSSVPNVGASGAIAGVLGAYILMFPQSRVNVLLGRQIVAMPAVMVLGMWIVLQLVSGVGTIAYTDESANAGGVAYMAHIGGFAAGLPHGVSVSWRKPSPNHAVSRKALETACRQSRTLLATDRLKFSSDFGSSGCAVTRSAGACSAFLAMLRCSNWVRFAKQLILYN